MTYPSDKELFERRSTDDVIPASDRNDVADFLERLQDSLGYNIQGAFSDVASRLSDIESSLGGAGYVARDYDSYDFTEVDFTMDNSYRSLDISGIVPAEASAVIVNFEITLDSGTFTGKLLGPSYYDSLGSIKLDSYSEPNPQKIVPVDNSGNLYYKFNNSATNLKIYCAIGGWFV